MGGCLRGGVEVSRVGRLRVFVEVDRLTPASWEKNTLILLGITGSTSGGCLTVAHPHIPALIRISPPNHPPSLQLFCFSCIYQPPSMNRSSSITTASIQAHRKQAIRGVRDALCTTCSVFNICFAGEL